MKYERPRLPYPTDALSPVISEETIGYHYGKHEQAYIDMLNKLIANTEYEDMPIEEIIRRSEGKLFNNASQAWNHIFYFFQFSPDPQKEPRGELRKLIDSQFGSLEEFRKRFEEAGAGLFGSGWVWLAQDTDGNLVIVQGTNASNPMRDDMKPLLVFDVWEHAYYLDYQNRRADYLRKLWDIVDWKVIEDRFR